LSTISPTEYFDRLHRIVLTLDKVNIKIIQTMKQEGPRNLQNVARVSRTAYTTVYSRVAKLERDAVLHTSIHPNYSRIGLTQANILITPFLGKELLAREALRIPGYWLKIAMCSGESNGYFAVVAVPSTRILSYQEYLEQLVARGIIRHFRISWLDESISPVTNFEYYSLEKKSWVFEWDRWFGQFKHQPKPRIMREQKSADSSFDMRDLTILKELMKDARVPLTSLAKMLSITLPATKYRFDDLVARGFVHDQIIGILPYAPEISELHQFRLDFTDPATRQNAEDVLAKLPFVLTYTRIKGMESIAARVYIPTMETRNLLSTLSRLVHDNLLANYSHVQLYSDSLLWSTFGYKDYNDKTGWFYDNRKYLQEAEGLVKNWEKQTPELATSPSPFVTMLQ
jgi:DNA-binding Lrp family transcriptional regulator